MNEDTVSALLDGEATPEQIEALLAGDDFDDQARRLARHAAIGQLMRGAQTLAAADFCDRVMAACTASAPVDPAVASATRGQTRRRRRWSMATAGAALAAAAGVAAVMVVPQWSGQRAEPSMGQVASLAAAPSEPAVAARTVPVRSSPAREVRTAQPRLASYVISYSNARSVGSVSGPLGYARLAAYAGAQYGDSGGP